MVLGEKSLVNIPGIVIPKCETAGHSASEITVTKMRQKKNELLFSESYAGAREDKFAKLLRRMRPLIENGGVMIEQPMSNEGHGPQVKQLAEKEAAALAKTADAQFSNIVVCYHYSAYLMVLFLA